MKTKISGVYKITNKITGDFYIGSSKNIKRRWSTHKCPSNWKNLPNSKLYKDFIKYELSNFTFEIIEETNMLKEREQYWINQLNPEYNDKRAKTSKDEKLAYQREYYKHHREKYINQIKEWEKIHHAEKLAYRREYYNRLCLYEGETLTLSALIGRFRKQNILHPFQSAKKYLLGE